MEHKEPLAPVDAIRHRVKELRTLRGLSAQGLADALDGVGLKWNRSIVANLEGGRRPTVSVVELLALAYVLDVSPLHLLVPPESRPEEEENLYQVTPSKTASRWNTRRWVRGFDPLPGMDLIRFHAAAPPSEYGVTWIPLGQRERLGQEIVHQLDERLGQHEPGEADGGDDGEHR